MKFESPLGSKQFASQPLREYDVPDESQYHTNTMTFGTPIDEDEEVSNIEREVKIAREMKRTGKERLNEGAKRRLEILLGMTRTTHVVDINGTKFEFQTLKSKEMREAIMKAAEFDGTIQSPFEIRKQFLARSLVRIAEVDFNQFIGSNSLEAKLEFIDELDDSLLNRLYKEYIAMVDESKNKFAIKNEDDAKGIVEDIKK